jgi:hypothetical protein
MNRTIQSGKLTGGNRRAKEASGRDARPTPARWAASSPARPHARPTIAVAVFASGRDPTHEGRVFDSARSMGRVFASQAARTPDNRRCRLRHRSGFSGRFCAASPRISIPPLLLSRALQGRRTLPAPPRGGSQQPAAARTNRAPTANSQQPRPAQDAGRKQPAASTTPTTTSRNQPQSARPQAWPNGQATAAATPREARGSQTNKERPHARLCMRTGTRLKRRTCGRSNLDHNQQGKAAPHAW